MPDRFKNEFGISRHHSLTIIPYNPPLKKMTGQSILLVPGLFTERALEEEVNDLNEFRGREVLSMEEAKVIYSQSPEAVVAHEVANIMGMSEEGAIGLVENTIRAQNNNAPRTIDNGQPVDFSKITVKDIQIYNKLITGN